MIKKSIFVWCIVVALVVTSLSNLRAYAFDGKPELLNRVKVLEVARDITSKTFPNSDFALVDEHITKVYKADGTYKTWDDEYVKILTEKGKRKYQTLSTYFTLPYGVSKFKKVEIIKANGRIVKIDVEANSREMVNPGQMSANIYNPNSKILQVGVPGLEIGDTIHVLSFDDIVKAQVPNTWSDYDVFEDTAPIVHEMLDIYGPTSLPLKNVHLFDEVEGTVSYSLIKVGDLNRYRWEIKDVPRIFPEPKMPATYTVVQRLLVSTIPDWESISRWYWKLSKPHLDHVTPEMKKKVAELIDGVDSRDEKIKRIFTFVSQQIRYMGITTEKNAPGYEPHDVSLTFGNRYGVCRDKAALLAAMLRLAGLPGYPVLIDYGPRKDESVPQPYFNHAIVAVGNDDGTYTLMDPTDEHTAVLFPAYLSYMSYLVARPEGEKLRTSSVVPALKNTLRINTKGALAADGLIKLTSEIKFDGINDDVYRSVFNKMKPEERKRFFEGQLKQGIAGAKLTGFSIKPDDMQNTSEPLSVKLDYEATDYPVSGDEYTLLAAPWLGKAFGYANWLLSNTGLDKRKYPYYTRLTAGVEESIEIKLDKVPDVLSKPDSIDLNADGVSYSQRIDIVSNKLVASSAFMIDSVEFSPEQYIDLKKLLKNREYEQRKKVVIKHPANNSLENDIKVLSDKTKIKIDDISNWTVTRSIQKKILTYAGKKANSELKIGFNPAWESIRIVSATVENMDGRVHKVAADEKNLMDASWVGSAPRYPPARTLVVSLPGVEKGSVVSYTIERKIFGKPFFSTMRTFKGSDPVESASMEITAPTNLPLAVSDMFADWKYVCTTNGSDVKHVWSIEPQEAIKPEDNLPPSWSFLPSVFVSTGDYESFCSEVNAHLEKARSDQKVASKKALELVSGVVGDRQKVLTIRNFVARNIRSAGPSLTSLPLSSISTADTVLTDGYGNTTDRAVLLASMLDSIGVKSEFVLASSWSPEIKSLYAPLLKVPQFGLFNYVLVKVSLDGETVYLNDTDQYAQLGCTSFDDKLGISMTGKPFIIEASKKMKDRSKIDFNIILSENGDAQMAVKRAYYGMEFGRKKRMYAELPPEQTRRHFKELVTSISQAAKADGGLIIKFDEYPGVRKFKINVPRYAVRSGKYLYITLPQGMTSPMNLKSDSRYQPLYRGVPMRQTVNYDIQLPKNTKDVVLLPPSLDWKGPDGLGNVEFSQKTDSTSGHILLKQSVDFKPAVIRPESYPTLLELSHKLKHPSTRTIMVELDE